MSSPVVAQGPNPQGRGISREAMLIGVALVLMLEVGLFCWSFGKFFCGDSLFYLWYRVETPAQVFRILTHPDHLHSYRPLTYIFFSSLLFPVFKLDPLGYHVVVLCVHLAVSLLFFRLLRELVKAPAAALAGMLWFGVHSVNFYITYDASFLPDFMHGLFCAAALLCYALHWRSGRRSWLAAGLISFLLALLSKESSVVLPAGVMVIDLLLRMRPRPEPGAVEPGQVSGSGSERPWWRPSLSTLPFFALALIYLGWTLYIKRGEIYPSGSSTEPYALTLAWPVMVQKLRYLAWFANLPTMFARRGWFPYAAIVAMAPALWWVVRLTARTARPIRRNLLACAAWAFAGLLPVLFINQFPMKHNLYLPVLSCAVGLALMVDRAVLECGSLPRGWVLFPAGLVLGAALLMPGELKYSWVGEASDIAENSLDMMKREHPALPSGALLYLLPTQVRGVSSWYFQDGALFKLFYGDRSLKMRFADQGASLPVDFATRPDVLILRLHDRRLWEITHRYKRDVLDRDSYRLIEHLASARLESSLQWAPSALPDGKDHISVRPYGRDERSRLALIQLPGSRIYFDLPPIPPDAVLQLGASLGGALRSSACSRIFFQDARGTELLALVTLDVDADAAHWRDWEVDLQKLAGRQGALILETERDAGNDWMLWSRMRIIQRSNPFYRELAADIAGAQLPPSFRLLELFDQAEISFDRTEVYPDYSTFGTPTGGPAFLRGARGITPPRYALVMIAGTTVRLRLPTPPPGSALEVAAANLGELGDGVRGQIFIEDGARGAAAPTAVTAAEQVPVDARKRDEVFNELLPAHAREWVSRKIPLDKWVGANVNLVLKASSGPRRETVGDWCAWARLRIVTKESRGD
jgi:hypothetical protein